MQPDPGSHWQEFLAAAEAWAAGDDSLARKLVAAHPIVRTELIHFARAIERGTLAKDAHGIYRQVDPTP